MGQPKLSNAQTIRQLLGIGPIGGLDATTDPSYVDGAYAVDMLNIVPNRTYKGYAPMRGRVVDVRFMIGNGPVVALTEYYPSDAAIKPILVAMTNVGGNGQLQSKDTTDPNDMWMPIVVPQVGGQNLYAPGEFASYLKWLFFSNGDPNGLCYKIDQNLNATNWQIAPPTAAPTEGSTSQGNIYGAGYYWRYTYSNADQESSPSPTIGPIDLGLIDGPPGSNTALIPQNLAPVVTTTTGTGSVPAGNYTVRITYLDASGNESQVSLGTNVTLTLTGELNVSDNSPPAGAVTFNIYVATGAGLGHIQPPNTAVGSTGHVQTYDGTTGSPPAYLGELIVPLAPSVSPTNAGSLKQRTEYYVLTYTNSAGESGPSPEASINLLTGEKAVISSPQSQLGATGYNVYGSTSSGQEVLQNTGGPIAIGTGWTEPDSGLILGQQINLNPTPSTDPQVTTINWYRIGGALGQWLLVGTQPNLLEGYQDNLPDNSVTGQPLVLHRDQPAPFETIFVHKERMCGFGYPAYTDVLGFHPARPCDFWYSNYVEPWGFDNTDQVIQLGAHDSGDPGVAAGSVGDIVFAVKLKTAWAIYGQSQSDFFAQKLFDVGCSSKGSFVVALGVAFWLSNQGVYMFDGSALTYLSTDIKKILDGMSSKDFAASVGMFSDRMYWLSFPTAGISLGYDTVGGKWWKSNMTSTIFAYDPEPPKSRPQAIDLVYGVTGDDDSPQTEQWFAAETDQGAPIGSALVTRIMQGDVPSTMRVRYVELAATVLSKTDSLLVTVEANPGYAIPPPFSQAFSKGPIPQQLFPVPPGLQGQELQLTIAATTSDAMVIEGAAVHGWVRRMYSTYG